MTNYYNSANSTALAVTALAQEQDQNVIVTVIKGGAIALTNYIYESGKLSDKDFKQVNWDIAYLSVLCDSPLLLSNSTSAIEHVCKYWGIDSSRPVSQWKPSPSVKAKSFGAQSLTRVAEMSGLGLSTLNKWAVSKPIVLHSLITQTAKAIIINEQVN